jgi:uncharacterized damage-inducible protein DinB
MSMIETLSDMVPLAAESRNARRQSFSPTSLSLVAVLRQLAELIERMSDAEYCKKPVGFVSGNIGGHVRHSLDHIDALLAAVEHDALDYDQRRRGTDVETSRAAALAAIARQEELLTRRALPEQRRLRLTMIINPDRAPVVVETTVGREAVFVLSHTIHHNALIAVLAKTLGVAVAEHFGYAPSTLAHMEKTACVR